MLRELDTSNSNIPTTSIGEARSPRAGDIETYSGHDGLVPLSAPQVVRLPPYTPRPEDTEVRESRANSTCNEPDSLSYSTLEALTAESKPKPKRLGKKYLGWTVQRWIFVLLPSVLAIVFATVLVSVFVTRGQNDSSIPSNTNTAPAPTQPSSPPNASKSGALNGTSIAIAEPNNGIDSLWVFYQDYQGDLRYIPLSSTTNLWGPSVVIQHSEDVANATALTAIYYTLDKVTHVRIIKEKASIY
jgi:branched-subunit amino acid transport protein